MSRCPTSPATARGLALLASRPRAWRSTLKAAKNNHDIFARIFDGGYPWPNWDELGRQKASPDPDEAEAARAVERAIEVGAEWLPAHTQAFAWTPEKEAELRQALISRCPGCSDRLHDAIRTYITWYGWHEGILQFPNRE